jgi:hypothetical protein
LLARVIALPSKLLGLVAPSLPPLPRLLAKVIPQRLAIMDDYLLQRRRLRLLPEPAPQSTHALPIEERDQQIGDVLDMTIGHVFAHEQIDDALRAMSLLDMALAPVRLLLGIGQYHVRPPPQQKVTL